MTSKELRTFAAVVGLGFVAIGALSWFRHRHDGALATTWVLWSIAGAILFVGLIAPRALGPFHRAWTAVGHVLGWVNIRIILGFVYFCMVAPLAMMLRVRGRDALRIRRRTGTHWVRRDGTRPASESYPRRF